MTTPHNDNGALQALTRLLITVGAARTDATPEQLEQLKDGLIPYMRDEFPQTGDTTYVYNTIAGIMGPNWQPSAEWREYSKGIA